MKQHFISWEQNEQEHAAERHATAEAIRSGLKTPRQMQEENAMFPLNATVEIKLDDFFERLPCAHETRT